MRTFIPTFSTVIVVAILAAGCLDSGLTIESTDDMAALEDLTGTDESSTVDLSPNEPQDATATEDTQDLVGEEEVVPEVSLPAGPTCAESLQCLVDMKNWQPGEPFDQGACLEGINDGEMEQVDDLLSCVDEKCVAEFEAFEDGGDAELATLYLCMIDNCATPISVCIGGHGEESCADAIFCLSACNPLDVTCTIPCLEGTDEVHSEKAGKFLQCALDDCGGMEALPACDISMACGLKCPELASGG